MRQNFIIFLILFGFISCSKKKNLNNSSSKFDFEKIFSKEDSKVKNEEKIKNIISNFYKTIWEKNNLSGGFLIAKGNHIIFEKYSGFGQPNKQMPINENTPLHIASTSKPMTAVTILKLVEHGKLSLEDKLTRFFPKFPYPQIRIIDLLTQRSGLPKYEYFINEIRPKPQQLNKKFLSNEDILNLLIEYHPALVKEPNTGFMYCNTNFALLALVVERVTNTKFPIAIQKILFDPLGMKHTFIFQEKHIGHTAESFYQNKKVFELTNLDLIYGDKNVYTTPRDLLRFSQSLYSSHFLNPELIKKIFTPYSNEKVGVNNYGIGFRMKIFDNGQMLTFHNGWWHGTNTVFAHLLDSKVTIIAIGNQYAPIIYKTLSLSSLFQDFPAEKEILSKILLGENLPDEEP